MSVGEQAFYYALYLWEKHALEELNQDCNAQCISSGGQGTPLKGSALWTPDGGAALETPRLVCPL